MTLDTESQRTLLLAAIEASNWPGSLAEEIVKLKFAVRNASMSGSSEFQTPSSEVQS